jgi:alpha-L-rhamnosidase
MPLILMTLLTASALARPIDLRCDYLTNPLGFDEPAPRLSWRSDSTARNWQQSAYQILIASSPAALRSGNPDVWDSGKQTSTESVGIPYAGPKLQPRHRYYWTVRVWDASGNVSEPSEPAWWETGLLTPSDWSARWIMRPDPEAAADAAPIRWIWIPGQNALSVPPGAAAVFRLEIDLPANPTEAALFLLARGAFRARVNGHDAGAKKDFRGFDRQDITNLLVRGKNSIEVTVTAVAGGRPGAPKQPTIPAAFAALLKIRNASGTILRFPTDSRWQARLEKESTARPAAIAGELTDTRFGPLPGPLPEPASLLRREFAISKPVRAARLYITALGSYRAFLNGHPVGTDVLTPEYTDYAKRVTYQTYDVTSLLTRGPNALGAILGEGWFGSGITWMGLRYSFLPPPTRLLAQLNITYTDGSQSAIGTDTSWKTAPAPILHSEIYAGEVYDARLEQPGWNMAGFHDANWTTAAPAPIPPTRISGAVTTPPRIVETFHPRAITAGPNGAWILDMGQNMVGWLKLRATGPAGARIRLRFAEILSPDGSLYTENLRNANATDVFYLRGGGSETLAPHFTFHGFRYVEVFGLPTKPALTDFTGEVISSAQHLTGKLTTSSDLVNRMWQVGIWGQRGNFLSIPTDCPQRDERLGWTGDAEAFWRTGSYNADIAAFGHKWMRDVTDDQTPEGAFGNVAPGVAEMGPFFATGAPGWGDAGVIVPFTAWQQYGDIALVREHWDAMRRWLRFIEQGNPDYLRKNRVGPNFADWLAPDPRTPRDLVATAYWAWIADLMSQMAHALGRSSEAAEYTAQFDKIRTAFQKAYIKPDGQVGPGTQTSYLLALHMKLVPDALLGTPHLLFALADNGRLDAAYRLLLTDTYPSWGYMIRKGATTWWERWNSDSGDPAMNSFNHYAFGSVVAWVYRYVAGIDTERTTPGFRQVIIRPRTTGPITHARGEYDSVYGKIISDWTTASGALTLRATIPPNTRATVYLPAKPGAKITEAGKSVETQPGPEGTRLVAVGSGSYEFRVQ